MNRKQKESVQAVEADQVVDDGVDGQAGGGVDVQFAGYVLAVGDDGVHGYMQHVGYFFVT